MNWWQFASYGAGGGFLVEILSIFACVGAWQLARKELLGRPSAQRPRMRSYVDVPAHFGMCLIRLLLGGAAAALFGLAGQITGAVVAVALGIAAPSVLARLGEIPQVNALVSGAGGATGTTSSVQSNVIPAGQTTPQRSTTTGGPQ